MDDVAQFKKAAAGKSAWLAGELKGLRTGRATPALLDMVQFEMYGSMMKLAQAATIAISDARTLYVTPWDRGQIKPMEKAITLADLGVSVGSDEKGVRVSFPELTAERRQQLIKLVHAKLEEARVALRGERTKVMADIEKNGATEDEEERLKREVQKVVDEANGALERIAEKKEAELRA